MKNLKINKKGIKALVGAIIVSTNLTACRFTQPDNTDRETYVTEDSILETENLQYLVICENDVEKIVPVNTLKLVNSKNEIVEKVDGVLVGNKIKNIENPVEIKFSLDIDKVIINDQLFDVSEFSLVNGDTLEKLNNVVGMYSDYEYTDLSDNPLFNKNTLTEEKFNELVEVIYNKYSSAKLDITKEAVRDYLMIVNIDKIATDNKELIDNIVGTRKIDEVVLNAFSVYSAILTENNNRYCSQNLGFDSIITVSDTVFDAEEKETVINIENRIKEIVLAKDNKEEFNKLLNKLLMDMNDSKNEEFSMKSGVGYSVMTVLVNFVRINFLNQLDETNSELIKYFVTFADDDSKYQENSMMSAYNRGFYGILNGCLETKTYTKTK